MAEARAGFWADVGSFGREILVAAIGVALGLWAQQLASDAGWRDTVANAKQDLRRELGEAVDIAAVVTAGAPCTDPFIARARALAMGEQKGKLPALAGVYLYVPQDAAWEAAGSSQAVGHLSHEDLEAYAFAYAQVRRMRDITSPLAEQQAVLRTLDVPRRERDPAAVQQWLVAAAQFEQLHKLQVTLAKGLIDDLKGQGIPVTADGVATGKRLKAKCTQAAVDVGALAPNTPGG